MSGFWEKTVNSEANQKVYESAAPKSMVLDEEALSELQEDPSVDLFEEEEDNEQELMMDVNLRLEQGRLYQMVLQGDIFAETNADPRAIRNVQREIRKFVRERMETMVGIRQEALKQETIISSPFNDMEVTVLKMLASKMSKGATEESSQTVNTSLPPPTPKKDGITAISGALRPQQTTPIRSSEPARPSHKRSQEPRKEREIKKSEPIIKSAISNPEGDSSLKKPIDQMTPEELAEHDKQALERRAKNKSALPSNLVPHPSPQELEMRYMAHAQQFSAVANTINLISGNK